MAITHKVWQRVLLIGNGAIFQLISAFSTAFVAYFIINFHSAALWGSFSTIWLYIIWLSLFFNFGNKDYLLKEYGKSKNKLLLTKSNILLRLPFLALTIFFSYLTFTERESFVIIGILIFSFAYSSYQPLLIYEKKFGLLLIMELVSIISQILYIFARGNQLTLEDLLVSFLIYQIVKFLFLVFRYQFFIKTYPGQLSLRELKKLLPFFLLNVGGLLINKADFVMVAAYLDHELKAYYQIISTFSTIGIIAAHAVLQPFISQIYRINPTSFQKMAQNYFRWGILLSSLYTIIVAICMKVFFSYSLSVSGIILLFAIELIFFATNPWIYYLFKYDKQQYFLRILLISGTGTLLISTYLVNFYGIEGALCANFTGNLILLFLILKAKSKLNSNKSNSLSI